MNILVAGTGSIGKRHIKVLKDILPACRFLFVRKFAREDHYSHSVNAEVFSTVEEALQHKVDLFVVSNPSACHYEFVLKGIEYALPMYIEKPLVTKASHIAAIKEAVNKYSYSQPVQVGCNLRFMPSLIQMKAALMSGRIGNVAHATFHAGQWLPDWRPGQDFSKSYSASAAMGGGVIFDLIHEIDSARWMLGQLNPLCCYSTSVESLNITSESVAMSCLRSSSNALVSLVVDYVSRKPLRRYQIVGDRGTLIWDLAQKKLVLQSSGQDEILCYNPNDFDMDKTYYSAMRELVCAIQQMSLPSQGLEDGLQTAALAIDLKQCNA